MPHDIFISYDGEDRDVAEAIRSKLRERGLKSWIAPHDIPPGKKYTEAIIEAIAGSRILLLVFSSRTNESQHVERELEEAFSRRLIMVPFRLEEVMPNDNIRYFIGLHQWMDAWTRPLDSQLLELADLLERTLAQDDALMRTTQEIELLSVRATLVLPDNRELKITKSRRTFGRADFTGSLSADDVLFIGRKHFSIARTNDSWSVEDLDTRNGTLLNNKEIKGAGRKQLQDGDEITVAKILKLVFRSNRSIDLDTFAVTSR